MSWNLNFKQASQQPLRSGQRATLEMHCQSACRLRGGPESRSVSVLSINELLAPRTLPSSDWTLNKYVLMEFMNEDLPCLLVPYGS